jgi:hypothetical protein
MGRGRDRGTEAVNSKTEWFQMVITVFWEFNPEANRQTLPFSFFAMVIALISSTPKQGHCFFRETGAPGEKPHPPLSYLIYDHLHIARSQVSNFDMQ